MGFDTVNIICYFCNNKIQIQSKAGECKLKEYDFKDAPDKILVDLSGSEVKCNCCGAIYKIETCTIAKIDLIKSPLMGCSG